MYSSSTIADFFIEKAIQEKAPIGVMKVLKLVYIAHGWYLGNRAAPLINADVEAWKDGPVINDLYHSLKHFGLGGVNKTIGHQSSEIKNDQDTIEFLEKIWNFYGKYTGRALSNLTHLVDTPWHNSYDGSRYKVIPQKEIQSYYELKVQSMK